MKNALSKGFTIVELVIVIAVIGILATITIVSYRGTQDRAEYARAQTDLKHINDALIIYKAQNGSYPVTPANYWTYQYPCNYCSTLNTNFIAELVPTYLDKMPIGKSNAAWSIYTYAYMSNGTDYKLIRIGLKDASTGLPNVEISGNPLVDTPAGRQLWSWGYWTDGGASW